MNANISFQDCERKAPPVNYPVMSLDAKPAGIDFKFSKGIDPRSHRPNVYTVSLTPAINTGKWENADDDGDLEHVKQQAQGKRVEGIWVEAGERLVFVLDYV
jgi:hypothetical protein